ncbi:hypothetical protein JQ597_28815 [Bradyrhizobium sp. AUGA SZCCT0177]|uniref:hypothetical protein n=1 Tax=Bradyrhizobium sp. AUGA SZCCT0177 TaxID=2807665 RepID=UPI001BA8E0B4|nr:hypothetical protein [Bradyrhizobium sp. AUGA SZCCT0177]MBR1286060.1 hypothetical protein [Bradyrhizobium sp. AUGA SZCCT0177]
MFDQLRYRWALRKFLKKHDAARRSYERWYDQALDDPVVSSDKNHITGTELNSQTAMIDAFRSKYLLEQAHRYHVPIPDKEEDWIKPRSASEPLLILTAAAAQKLRADIRAEQKADWDYWANRVTLALALIGSIFGVLAFFKK